MKYSFFNKNSRLLIYSLLTLLLGLSLHTWYQSYRPATLRLSGTFIEQPLLVPSFQLEDEQGHSFTQKNLLGQYHFLFFGYTQCRGICPLTMMILTELYAQIKKEQLPIPQIVFISLDPEHDQPLTLRNYVRAFHPEFKGLTGSLAAIQQLSRQLGVVYIKTQQNKINPQVNEINHSGTLYLVNPQGQLISLFSPPHDKAALLEDYKYLSQRINS